MPPRKNPNIESITEEYIDGAVKVHVKASEVPPRQNLNISFKDADMLGDEVTLSNQEAYEESHGKIYEMTHNNTVPWRNWAFYMILVSMLTVCFTFAKYASFASGDAQAAVAKFDVVVTGSAASTTHMTVNPTSIPDPGNGTGTINVVFDADSPETATRTIIFNVANNSDVTVKIVSAVYTPANQNKHHSVESTITSGGDSIQPNASGTVELTIHKYTAESFPDDSGTLVIKVEQVD